MISMLGTLTLIEGVVNPGRERLTLQTADESSRAYLARLMPAFTPALTTGPAALIAACT
jgi:hypothetical protein